tara:strand:+ start:59 stop:1915 length:1857 start_codon:yes stop_codon:yes gene_type:complete
MESIEQTFNGQADFGRRVTCTISRNGDLAYRTYLQVTLPEINQQMANTSQSDVYARWLDFPGEQLISQVEVEIGGQRIDRQYGDWMHIWNQLTLSAEQERGYHQMIGNTTALTYITDPSFNDVDGPCESTAPRQVCAPRNALPETTLYIPFQFWYCRNPGLALPLIALQYHEVKINLDIRPTDECLWAVSTLDCGSKGVSNLKVTTAYAQSLVAASLYVDYVFLDTDERRRMAQNPHEYLIEQLQFTGDESVGSSSNKIKLNFNHPCKELIWVVQPDENVDYCASLECTETLYKLLGAQPFNYTDAVDALPNAIHAFSTQPGLVQQDANGVNVGYIDSEGLFQQAGPVGVSGVAACIQALQLEEQVENNAAANSVNNADAINALMNGGSAEYKNETRTAAEICALVSQSKYGMVFSGFNSANGVNSLFGSSPPGAAGGFTGSLGGQAVAKGASGLAPSQPSAQSPSMDMRSYGSPNFGVDANQSQLVGVSDAGTFVLSETALTMHCWGQNPVVTAKLQLNGQDRFSEREGTYFDLVQPFQHHTRNPDTGINVYSFALRPEEHQPSGTCNFSRIDNATLQLVLSNATVEGTKTAKVRVYATNYNVLRVMSGMGGLAYSN